MGRRRRVDRFVPAGCLLAILTATARGGGDVPLELWSSPAWPSGLDFGDTNGIAFGDFDADGWIDVFVPQAALLWRNVDGTDWVLASDLSDVLTMPALRFGASFADWNEDGLPDVATEGRNVCTPFQPCPFDECSHLLLNTGDGQFEDVSTAIVDTSLCNLQAETFCWGDVDGDLDLDLFMPAYAPGVLDSPGNLFLENLGPGELGVYRFTEAAVEVGVRNDISMPRPEGAQFADVDLDGDLDLFSNAILYQNVSTLGSPQFAAMEQGASGIILDLKDQGVAFFDYDLDGDYDLAAIYPEAGAIIWENAGDGTFFYPGLIVEDPFQGLDVGLSTADWDNDGDIDYTTQQVFRRNMLIETGQRFFETAPTSIPLAHRMFATPAWGDWDKDGDLDCALGNWSEVGRFYDNVLYSDATDPSARRSLRIRCVRDSDGAPGGTETEFGASVEIDIVGDPIRRRRKAFVASGHGYLNQSEYTLHFGLPADPVPADPNEDLRFDIIADFPSLPSQGPWRVDKHVNKALGDLNLAELAEREITIFRSGRVVVDGTNVKPSGRTPRLTVAGGSLAVADPLTGIAPIRAVDGETWAGVAFDTRAHTGACSSRRSWSMVLSRRAVPSRRGTSCYGTSPTPRRRVSFWNWTAARSARCATGGFASPSTCRSSSAASTAWWPTSSSFGPRRSLVPSRTTISRCRAVYCSSTVVHAPDSPLPPRRWTERSGP